MNATVAPAAAATSGERLPEKLHSAGTTLFTGDAVCALAIVIAFGAAGEGAPAFLTLAATLLIALASGRYRWTFASQPHEEWYASGGVALLGLLCGLVLSGALHFDWFVAIASAVLWTAIDGAIATWMTRNRRGSQHYDLSIDRVRERPLSAGGQVERGFMRFLDAVLAAAALVILSPVIAIVALAVAIDDGFPLIFAQTRVARDDGAFTMYKVRTMRKDADSTWVAPGDERITKSGAFLRRSSLDELPQLWNVLRGEMSLVGPRPEMREYADRFAREYPQYSQRHIIVPGLTGWAQLYLPRNLAPSDAPEVLRYDLFYVQHAGLYLYSFCLIKTACEFIGHRAV